MINIFNRRLNLNRTKFSEIRAKWLNKFLAAVIWQDCENVANVECTCVLQVIEATGGRERRLCGGMYGN